MTTLEKSLTTNATPEDLKVISLIISKMTTFDGYYGNLAQLHTELQYKEFSTLSDDFKNFHREIIFNSGKYSILELASLKRSLILLQNKNLSSQSFWDIWFQKFLHDSISTLDLWLNEILEQIIEDVT